MRNQNRDDAFMVDRVSGWPASFMRRNGNDVYLKRL